MTSPFSGLLEDLGPYLLGEVLGNLPRGDLPKTWGTLRRCCKYLHQAAGEAGKLITRVQFTKRGAPMSEITRGLAQLCGPALREFTFVVYEDVAGEELATLLGGLPPGLRSLSLQFTEGDLSPGSPQIWEKIGELRLLERLSLRGIEVPAEGFGHIAGLTRLRSLAVNGSDVTGEMLSQIAPLPLVELDVWFPRNNREECVRVIASIKTLERLVVSQCNLTDRMVESLCSLSNLTHLDLSHNYLVALGISHTRRLRRLKTLVIGGLKHAVIVAGEKTSVLKELQENGVSVKYSPADPWLAPRSLTGNRSSEPY